MKIVNRVIQLKHISQGNGFTIDYLVTKSVIIKIKYINRKFPCLLVFVLFQEKVVLRI